MPHEGITSGATWAIVADGARELSKAVLAGSVNLHVARVLPLPCKRLLATCFCARVHDRAGMKSECLPLAVLLQRRFGLAESVVFVRPD